jgi:tetratricopeptide (TPR) repeat protein
MIVILSCSVVSILYPNTKVVAQQLRMDQPRLQIISNNPSILVSKGIDLLYNQGNYTEAKKYFSKALAIDHNNLPAIFYMGAALQNLGNRTQGLSLITRSIVLSDRILSKEPKNVDVLTIVGRAFNRLGNYTDAIKYFDRALAINPSYEYALANKGVALNKLGNYTEAIKYFDKALAIDSNFVYALGSKAETFSNRGDYSSAFKYFADALMIYPNNVQYLTQMAIILDNLGKHNEATTLIDRALSLNPNYVVALDDKALILARMRNYGEATKYLNIALAIDPSDSFAIKNKAIYLAGLKIQEHNAKNGSPPSNIYENKTQDSHVKISSADYTFMVYFIGSDLEAKSYAATQNIRQMESVGSNSKVNIVIETGGGSNQTKIDSSGKRFIDFTKVQRHKVLNNDIETISDLGKQNMGDPKTLSDFISWGMSNFPAKKYAIILWDHGSGINGFGGDPQFNYDKLTIDEIKNAFADSLNSIIDNGSSNKFELIGFDSCLMASIEVANSISSFSNYMIASQEIEPPWGWDYSYVLRRLTLFPDQDGALLGKSIADSYFRKSADASLSQGYDAQKEVTMSVINLTRLPLLVNNLNDLAGSVDDKLVNFTSIISFVKSIDASEKYGLTNTGNSGLVDIYDLATNIVRTFPTLLNSIDLVQNSLNNTVTYKTNGASNPNAHGLSIYMPVKQGEFTDSRKYTLPSWQKIVDLQYNLTTTDNQSPFPQSSLMDETIRGRIYANDVAKVTLWAYSSTLPEGNTVIRQDIDPSSIIKKDGSFEYKWNKKILSLCVDQTEKKVVCKPSIFNLESTRDKRFVLIPVRLKSLTDNVDERVSLKYELNNNGNFTFLGARPEVKQEDKSQPTPKEIWPLKPNDKVYPVVYTFTSVDQAISDLLQVEYDAIQVPHNSIFPRYVSYNGTFDIFLRICDYNDNCWRTRWVHLNDSMAGYPEAIDLGKLKLSTCKLSQDLNYSTYDNSTYKFAVQYPANWQTLETGSPDPTVVVFHSPDSTAQMYIDIEYWPGTYKDFVDDVTNTKQVDPFSKTLMLNSTLLGGYPAYESITQAKGVRSINVDALVAHTWYTLTFAFMSNDISKVHSSLATVKRMTDSFQICTSNNTSNSNQLLHRDGISVPTKLNIQKFLKYTNPAYKIVINYPSLWHIKENYAQGEVILYSPRENSSFFKRDESEVGIGVIYSQNASTIYKNGTFLKQLAADVIDGFKRDLIGFHLYESQPVIFHGNYGYRATYSYYDPGSRLSMKETDVTTVVNNHLYVFEYFGELSRYQHYFPLAQSMLNSVEFKH